MQKKKKLQKPCLPYILPITALLLVQPFLVRFHLFETGLENVLWTNSDGYSTDLYLYWKSVFFLVISTWMLILLVLDRNHVKKHIKDTNAFRTSRLAAKKVGKKHLSFGMCFWLLLCGYLIFVLLSALSSDYPAYAWGGSIGQFESTFVLIGYIVSGFYAYIYCKEPKIRKKFPYFLMLQAGAMGIIGAFQFVGHDLFALSSMQRLFIPADVLKQSGGIVFSMEKNRVYLTLYNPNYAGIYCACMIAIFFSLLLSEHLLWKRSIYIALIGLMTVSLIGTQSKTGIIIVFLALFFLLFLHKKSILRRWRILFPCTALAILFAAFLIRSSPVDLIQLITDGIFPVKSDYHLTELHADEEGLHVTYDCISFDISMEVGKNSVGIAAYRKDGEPMEIIECTDGSSLFCIVSEGLPNIPLWFIDYQGIICMDVLLDESHWIITNQLAPVYLYLNRYGKFDTITMPETAIFTDYPTWLTYRGHIWARSIPLLKNHILLGSGADTFLMEYPNNDYLGVHQSKTYGEYTTRPHNWYLQVGIQTGAVSLLFLLSALFLYMKNGSYFCIHNIKMTASDRNKNESERLLEACFIGTTVILLMNLTNDSSICTTPLLWCMIGMALSCMENQTDKT